MFLGLVLTYYFGSAALSQFEHAAVLREGQVVGARVKSRRSFRGVIVATIEYDSMAKGREIARLADVSLGDLNQRPKLGEQIGVRVRPGPCAMPVSRTAIQWSWIFTGFSLLTVAIMLGSAVNLERFPRSLSRCGEVSVDP
ncbi:hypothetical protein [Methylobacterium sp. 37f]|uniref:hypothetical protein n=1 Tax=Methylobacterium sp. 37f TaxID=2817058 RepID=UPI001FFDE619|nr:hypothetical protein [Methylobacterium sp. 37f]MCK2056843.1 hypothetical protein [Methylobacterium sp. 37f]